MREVVLQGVLATTSIWEIWLVYQIVYITILEKEYLGKKEKIIIWGNIIVLGSLLAVNRSVAFFSYVMLIFSIIVTSLCVWSIKRKAWFSIIGVVFAGYILIAVLDFFFAFLCMDFLKADFKHVVFIYAVSCWKSTIYVVSRVIIWYMIHMLKMKKADIGREIQEYRWILLAMNFLLYMLMRNYQIVMVRMVKGKEQIRGVDSGISLLIISVMILFAGLFLLKYQILKKEKEILIIRENMMSEKYQEMLKTHQIVHDMKNHFIILQRYEREQEWEKLSKYIEEISRELLYTDIRNWTGEGVLDFILSQKKAEAERKHIKFCISTTQLTGLPFSDNECISLFGNLLDNAIEACEKIQNKGKRIEVKMKKQNFIFSIEIINSIEELPLQKSGELISTKKNKKIHGYGIKSIKKIVKKYNGTFGCQVQEDGFHVNLSFFDDESVS